MSVSSEKTTQNYTVENDWCQPYQLSLNREDYEPHNKQNLLDEVLAWIL